MASLLNAKQLVWRCRRGVRELDVLLGQFLETDYPSLPSQLQIAFQRLLELQDPLIMDWLFARSCPDDPDLLEIINRIRLNSGLEK
ncbi:MAG: succinate dehydrogenase assembly factor 2 [Gammaproteobacteria bacterium]|nr:succinate dehydrogenase assembly factor 2 [Gammaproteobacteria bacterium]